MPRNPKWTHDKLILALDLYFKVNPLHASENHPDISSLCNSLNTPHMHANAEDNIRNPNGSNMKPCHFLDLNPPVTEQFFGRFKLEKDISQEFQ
ncbi:MAG: hypothetical protein P4L44_07370 [Oryzomonas sp.]|uniref:hypothetical protein n=1 Tax=Oryzomonas sp. TaxID=2855186 RepID=UPI00283DB2AD|nr:hypothetical protein [Oryzomonas sp.]MDR3579763.1 hypothetical protein [Oryzomonas sp.]